MKTLFILWMIVGSLSTAHASDESNKQASENYATGLLQKNLSPARFDIQTSTLTPEVYYKVLSQKIDWRKGHTTFYIGVRRADIDQAEFVKRLDHHVKDVATAFVKIGLKGYVFIATQDFEIAIQNWDQESSMRRAFFETEEGKAIHKDADSFMEMEKFVPANQVPGAIEFVERSRL